MNKVSRALLLSAVLAAAAPVATVRVAYADAPSASAVKRATELKKQADALMDDNKFADAYGIYQEAYAISADPALLYNGGRALEAMGDYPRALAQLQQFDTTAPKEVKALVPALDELIANLKARVTKLVVRCEIAHAKVVVREQLVGEVDAGKIETQVRAGKADISVLAEGYEPVKLQNVELPGGGERTLDVKLVPSKDIATIEVKVKPEGSLVTVDGKSFGPAPVQARVAAGSHEVVLHHAGFEDALFTVQVNAGETRMIDTGLKEPPSVLTKWWFWTAVGGVAVTGIVVTAALVSEKGADSGTFSPGQVRGPFRMSF